MSMMFPAAAKARTRPELLKDIAYAQVNGISLRMDASLPVASEKTPAVIIVHGGGWVGGDRTYNVQPLFQPLTQAGLAWFSIDYRLARSITDFGVAIDDVQAAVRYVKAHASEYNVDPNRIALLGESAGGQLAAMAALRTGGETVSAIVTLYTPFDLVSLAKTSEYIPPAIRDQIHGTPWEGLVLAGLGQLSPINSVRPGMPPFLLIHGAADRLVPFSQSENMCGRIRAQGGSCDVFPVPGGGHGIRWWESNPKLASPYKAKLVEWLRIQLRCF